MKQMIRFTVVASATLALLVSTASAAFAQQQQARQPQQAQRPQQPPQAQQDEIRRVLVDEYTQAENSGNVDAKMRLYLADAVLLPAEGEPAVGYQAVRVWHHGFYGKASSQISTSVDEVQLFGNWAFARGSWSGTTIPKAGGQGKQETGKFLILLRRQPDGGSWRIAREIRNAQALSAAADLK